jgi:hypothetical protein
MLGHYGTAQLLLENQLTTLLYLPDPTYPSSLYPLTQDFPRVDHYQKCRIVLACAYFLLTQAVLAA